MALMQSVHEEHESEAPFNCIENTVVNNQKNAIPDDLMPVSRPYGSKTLTDAETRYTNIGRELGMVARMKKFHTFCYG